MDECAPELVIKKLSSNEMIADLKVKFKIEKFLEYEELSEKNREKDGNIKDEISTQGNLNLTCSIIFWPLYSSGSYLNLDIKGFDEVFWKSRKHQFQVVVSVQDFVVADSGLKNIVTKDVLKVLHEGWKLVDRSSLIERLTDGSLVFAISIRIFGPVSNMAERKLRYMNQNSEVVKLTSKVLESGSYSDFTINVQDEKFKVHRNILAAASPVFDRMFSTSMVESTSRECTVEHIKPQIFKQLLEFIYAGKVPEDVGKVAKELFEAAHYYEVNKLKEICERELPDKLAVENAMDFYEWAFTYDLEELKLAAWKIIKRYIINDYTLGDNKLPPVDTIQRILDQKNKLKEMYQELLQ